MVNNGTQLNRIKSVCVFCGSKSGIDQAYTEIAQQTGNLLAGKHITLVYGGGCIGLMGEVARAALSAGGHVIGVIPEFLEQREVALKEVQELIIVPDMHQRKRRFLELSDAFIALPGGIGTLEEVTEVLSWYNLNLHTKPLGLVNTLGFFNPFMDMLKQTYNSGFLDQALLPNVHIDESIKALLQKLEQHAGSSIADTQLT